MVFPPTSPSATRSRLALVTRLYEALLTQLSGWWRSILAATGQPERFT